MPALVLEKRGRGDSGQSQKEPKRCPPRAALRAASPPKPVLPPRALARSGPRGRGAHGTSRRQRPEAPHPDQRKRGKPRRDHRHVVSLPSVPGMGFRDRSHFKKKCSRLHFSPGVSRCEPPCLGRSALSARFQPIRHPYSAKCVRLHVFPWGPLAAGHTSALRRAAPQRAFSPAPFRSRRSGGSCRRLRCLRRRRLGRLLLLCRR